MNNKNIGLVLACLGFIACGRGKERIDIIKNHDLIVKNIEIIGDKNYKGELIGINWDKNEAYIKCAAMNNKYTISIVDMDQDKIINSRDLSIGDMQSPTDVYNPSFMAYVANRYYLIDQYNKLLIFDQNLTYQETIMFKDMMYRHFIDLYSRNEDVLFLVGKVRNENGIKRNCSIREYRLANSKIEQIDDIFAISHKSNSNSKSTDNIIRGMIWSSTWGFEKDGKIYFGNGAENKYRVYDRGKKETTTIKLDMLEGMSFTDSDVHRLYYDIFQSGEMKKKIESRGMKYSLIPYPEELYYVGFYDVGNKKIGVAGSLDLKSVSVRLDIINLVTNEYEESLLLPAGHGLLRHLDEYYLGLFETGINVDKKIYAYTEYDPEEGDFYVRIIRFRIVNEKANMK